jgi:hypothetical protein
LQTHYFSENVVAPGIEPGPLDLYPGTLQFLLGWEFGSFSFNKTFIKEILIKI